MSGGPVTIEADNDEVLAALGIDVTQITWRDFALCDGMPTNLFYDDYESDENVAKMIDEACLSCPVMAQCLQSGIENGEWGVWGAVYLTSGKQDDHRNSHKTPDIWEQIREKISE